MTVTDQPLASAAAPASAAFPAPFAMVPFDLYRDIHKAIRVQLFDVTAAAGRLDPLDTAARVAHAARVRDLGHVLESHAHHEDTHIEPLILEVLPASAERIAAEHASLEDSFGRLVGLAELAVAAGRDDQRAAVHELYLGLASFTSRYLAHQHDEERVVMPALCDEFGVEPLLAVNGAIVGSIPPDEMAMSLSMMLPAMNVDDRTEMLGGMRATAPAEVFAGVWGLAGQVLTHADLEQLAQRLGM